MRNIVLTLAGAAAALGLAGPAAAQYYPAYARPVYGYGYGYNTAAVAQNMQSRVANVRAHVRDMQARGMVSWGRARTLDREAANLQRSVDRSAWNGISPGEARSLDARIASLERRVATTGYHMRYAPAYRYRRY
jgi:hypothetical protein